MHVPTRRVRRGSRRRAARCGHRRTEHPGDQEANASRAHVTPGKTSNKGFLGCFVSVWGFFGVVFFHIDFQSVMAEARREDEEEEEGERTDLRGVPYRKQATGLFGL